MIMGIDPGLTGGITILDSAGQIVEAIIMPTITETFMKKGKKRTRNLLDLVAIRDFMRSYDIHKAIIEKVAARPNQGSVSMFRFGLGVGELRGLMTALDIDFVDVIPRTWKKSYALLSDKEYSLAFARERWPDYANTSFRLKKHDGIAESAIIALYLKEKYQDKL